MLMHDALLPVCHAMDYWLVRYHPLPPPSQLFIPPTTAQMARERLSFILTSCRVTRGAFVEKGRKTPSTHEGPASATQSLTNKLIKLLTYLKLRDVPRKINSTSAERINQSINHAKLLATRNAL